MATGISIGLLLVSVAAVFYGAHIAKGSGAAFSMPGAAPECPHARVGVAFYRSRFSDWRAIRGLVTSYPAGRKPKHCSDARYLAGVWEARSLRARMATEVWIQEHTLYDFEVRPGNSAWYRAIAEAQKVFPGTDGILITCSTSEGGHGRWVRHGGGAYYPGYSGVGGWLQFLPGTFTRHFSAALEVATSKRFRVPRSAHSWLSPLGQALAGAWGLTYSRGEWAGAGCR